MITRPAQESLHDVRFPGESDDYRHARDELLRAEIELRRQIEAVARQRRQLPLGGVVPEDYAFLESGEKGEPLEQGCPSCTSIIDAMVGSTTSGAASCSVARPDPDQHPRHVDFMWPLWAVFDRTPEGRGSDWKPELDYG